MFFNETDLLELFYILIWSYAFGVFKKSQYNTDNHIFTSPYKSDTSKIHCNLNMREVNINHSEKLFATIMKARRLKLSL